MVDAGKDNGERDQAVDRVLENGRELGLQQILGDLDEDNEDGGGQADPCDAGRAGFQELGRKGLPAPGGGCSGAGCRLWRAFSHEAAPQS
jgi:hypothetical protein